MSLTPITPSEHDNDFSLDLEKTVGKKRKKSKVRMIMGIVFITFQLFAYLGKDKSTGNDESGFTQGVGYFIGFNFLGIIGLALLLWPDKRK
jgi:hypothetical protein